MWPPTINPKTNRPFPTYICLTWGEGSDWRPPSLHCKSINHRFMYLIFMWRYYNCLSIVFSKLWSAIISTQLLRKLRSSHLYLSHGEEKRSPTHTPRSPKVNYHVNIYISLSNCGSFGNAMIMALYQVQAMNTGEADKCEAQVMLWLLLSSG